MNKPCLLIFGSLICGFGPLTSVRGEYVYWGMTPRPLIQRADLDSATFQPEGVIDGSGGIVEIAVDATNGKVYWINRIASTDTPLLRANLDGSVQETLTNRRVVDFWLSEDGAFSTQ